MLWIKWFEAIRQLEPAFNRKKTFYWFVLVCMGLNLRTDFMGVASIVRALRLKKCCYQSVCDFFHSSAIDLRLLTQLWSRFVLSSLAPFLHIEGGRKVFLLDGIKAPKEGRKMPLVKLHHQESQNNSKPQYIWGHGAQAICVLATVGVQSFAIPLILRIQDGLGPKSKSILDKAIDLMRALATSGGFYMVGDAYYYSGQFFIAIRKLGGDVISRVRSNAVGYLPVPENKTKKRGRPQKYGKKIKLKKLFKSKGFREETVRIYGKEQVVEIKERILISKSFGQCLKFVWVKSSRGNCIFCSTDLGLAAKKIIELYGLRFKIEVSFKELVQRMGAFCYRFWSKKLDRSRKEGEIKRNVLKESTYQLHLQLAAIVHGMLIYLGIVAREQIWKQFNGWLRTIRRENIPTPQIVQMALSDEVEEFYVDSTLDENLRKFIESKRYRSYPRGIRVAA